MSNQFDAYEGFKIACLTCSRTLSEIDGIEVSSKLLWSILSMYQAIIYAMLSNPSLWVLEKNKDHNYDLADAIKKSPDVKKIGFVNQYLTEQEEKQKIDDIQLIRHNVIHANSTKLKQWEEDIGYLVNLLELCLSIALQVTKANEQEMKDDKSKRMRQFCYRFHQEMRNLTDDYPRT